MPGRGDSRSRAFQLYAWVMGTDDIRLAVEAATLLGRWTQLAERHANGCSCCPGLGDVAIEAVEERVLAWLHERHPALDGQARVGPLLRDCVARRSAVPPAALPALFSDLDEALEHLERLQRGF